jgi:hypothetical protein
MARVASAALGSERVGMIADRNQKTYWDLLETLRWILTRDAERVAAMWDVDEDQRIAVVMFDVNPELDPRLLLTFQSANPAADREAAGPQGGTERSGLDGVTAMAHDKALDDLAKRVHSRRVRMTAVRCDGSSDEQIPVPLAELNDLRFRLMPGHPVASLGLWSRSRKRMSWRSPQFLRADVISAWPARNTKTTAVVGAILRHLQKIMIPEAPLPKPEAQKRCMAEVPNAYPGAFEKAWAQLEATRKRGRGKHGPRVYRRTGNVPIKPPANKSR